MPLIPQLYGQQTVQVAPFPQALVSTNVSAFDTGLGQGVAQLGNVLAQNERQARIEKAKTDDIAVNAAVFGAKTDSIDATDAYGKLGGHEALAGLAYAESGLADSLKKRRAALVNPDQQAAFDAHAYSILNGFHAFAANRASNEGFKLDDSGYEDLKGVYIAGVGQTAATGNVDLTFAAIEAGTIEGTDGIAGYFARNAGRFGGIEAATKLGAAASVQFASDLRVAAIQQALAQPGGAATAKVYFDAFKGALSAEAIARYGPLVEKGVALGEAQRLEDEIFNLFHHPEDQIITADEHTHANDYVRERITDPELRKSLLPALDARFKQVENLHADAQAERFTNLVDDIAKKGRRFSDISVLELDGISGAQYLDLQALDLSVMAGKVRDGDPAVENAMLDVLTDAAQPFDPQGGVAIESAYARSKLSDKAYQKLKALWEAQKTLAGTGGTSSKSATDAATKLLSTSRTEAQIIGGAVGGLFGKDKTAEKGEDVFRQSIADTILSEQIRLGRELEPSEVQIIVNAQTSTEVRTRANGPHELPKPVYLLTPDDITVEDDIDPDEAIDIRRSLARQGIDVTDENIKKRWLALKRVTQEPPPADVIGALEANIAWHAFLQDSPLGHPVLRKFGTRSGPGAVTNDPARVQAYLNEDARYRAERAAFEERERDGR